MTGPDPHNARCPLCNQDFPLAGHAASPTGTLAALTKHFETACRAIPSPTPQQVQEKFRQDGGHQPSP